MMEKGLSEVKGVLSCQSVLHREETREKTPKGVYKGLQGGKKSTQNARK
jgi:hypothetical protein